MRATQLFRVTLNSVQGVFRDPEQTSSQVRGGIRSECSGCSGCSGARVAAPT